MMWEMWYGEVAFLEMKGQDLEAFLVKVEGGDRPDLTGATTQTSIRWSELISGCWANAAQRSALADCKSAITAILADQK